MIVSQTSLPVQVVDQTTLHAMHHSFVVALRLKFLEKFGGRTHIQTTHTPTETYRTRKLMQPKERAIEDALLARLRRLTFRGCSSAVLGC